MGTVGFLLDTHTYLWAVSEDRKLSANAHRIIENPTTTLFVSAVSAYEVINKYRIGKLPGYSDIAVNYLHYTKMLCHTF